MPTEDAADQIDHSEILQVTSPEKSAGLQPWELLRNLALLWCHHLETAAAFAELIAGHMILKNLRRNPEISIESFQKLCPG